jgi:hypothetical protein
LPDVGRRGLLDRCSAARGAASHKPTAPLASKGAAHQTEVEASVWVAPLDTGRRVLFQRASRRPRSTSDPGPRWYCLQRWPLRAKLRSSAAMTDGQPERERLLTDRAR